MGELSERLGCVLGGWPKPPKTTQAEAHGQDLAGNRACAAHGCDNQAGAGFMCFASLTFELSGPVRWTAGPARCSITERTAQALTAAVAGPLERRVRPAREVVKSSDRADQASKLKGSGTKQFAPPHGCFPR